MNGVKTYTFHVDFLKFVNIKSFRVVVDDFVACRMGK